MNCTQLPELPQQNKHFFEMWNVKCCLLVRKLCKTKCANCAKCYLCKIVQNCAKLCNCANCYLCNVHARLRPRLCARLGEGAVDCLAPLRADNNYIYTLRVPMNCRQLPELPQQNKHFFEMWNLTWCLRKCQK